MTGCIDKWNRCFAELAFNNKVIRIVVVATATATIATATTAVVARVARITAVIVTLGNEIHPFFQVRTQCECLLRGHFQILVKIARGIVNG